MQPGNVKLQQAFERFQSQDLAGTERLCSEVLRGEPDQPDALHLLGIVRMITGRPGEAVDLISRALEARPRDAVVLENLGVAHLAASEPAQAETLFRQALAQGSSHALLHMRLGLALGAQGKLAEAVQSLRAAAERSPDDPNVHLNLGNALAEQGREEEALDCYRRTLALEPRHVDAYYNIGTLHKRRGRNDEAIVAYRAVLAQMPDHADARHNLGTIYQAQGRDQEAMDCYRGVLAGHPEHVPSLNNLGNVLFSMGRHEEAIALYERALRAAPAGVDAYVNLGNARAAQGRHEEAGQLYGQAIRLDPATVEAHQNLGDLHVLRGAFDEAIACYRRTLEQGAAQHTIHLKLGHALRQAGDLRASTAAFRRALELRPGDPDAGFNLGENLKLAGKLDEAAAWYERSLAGRRHHLPALSALIHVRQHMCDWKDLEEQWRQLREELPAASFRGVSPFSIASWSTSAAELRACAEAWAREHVEPFTRARSRTGFDFSGRRRRERLRIGYLSWGFHRHATSYWAAELFELHDRGRHEILAYDYGPDDGSEIRARVRAGCDRFVEIAGLSHPDAARRIYDDGVDILVDLTGYTLGSRPQIVAFKPAPVQVNWFYPGTMGTPVMDYFIADPFVVPAGAEGFYAERIARLPDCYMITDRKRARGDRIPTREECGLPAGGIVFCCFNQAYKILPQMFGIWMRILAKVPGSVLWLAEANRWQVENLRREAALRGVDGARLVFAARKPLDEYMAQYRIADCALDTFPYTSHTTASDALWMGCPLVTCAGETFPSRVAGSVLAGAGMKDLAVDSLEDYERTVLDLAGAPEKLRELRRRLEETRGSSALFDTPRFVRNLEQAYEAMFESFLESGRNGGFAPGRE